jgi:hypothetical protein
MLQSKAGSKLTNKYTRELNPNFFAQRKTNRKDEDSDDEPKEPKDISKLFPSIMLGEKIIEKTATKLRHDEKAIVEKLITKYGSDNHIKMAKDIKVNYL